MSRHRPDPCLDNECHDTDLDCFKKIANDWFGDGGSNNGYAAPAPYAPSSPYAAAAPSYPTAVSPYGGAYPNAYPSNNFLHLSLPSSYYPLSNLSFTNFGAFLC